MVKYARDTFTGSLQPIQIFFFYFFLVPHFLILHDSNKIEDYSLDPIISPPVDYGSWSDNIFPLPRGEFGYALIEPDMTLGKDS